MQRVQDMRECQSKARLKLTNGSEAKMLVTDAMKSKREKTVLRYIQWHFFFWSAVLLVSCQAIMVAQANSRAANSSEASVPPGYSIAHTGTVHDFDYFEGGWTTHQRRLKTRGVGSNEWEEFPGNLCMRLYLDGMATVDEIYFPTKGTAGLTVRMFDPNTHQWSIYWASSATGKLDPVPVVGGFEGNHGEFYASDQSALPEATETSGARFACDDSRQWIIVAEHWRSNKDDNRTTLAQRWVQYGAHLAERKIPVMQRLRRR